MIMYILVATFFFAGFFLPVRYQEVHYRLSLVLLFFFTAFRNTDLGGWDAIHYQKFFFNITPQVTHILDYVYDYELGYAFLNFIVRMFTANYQIYQLIYTFLSVFLLSIVIKKTELSAGDKNLFLFIYFCYRFIWNNFILLRQNIAILIIWIAFLTFLEKPIKYYLSIGISWFFHTTSVVNIFILKILNYFDKFNRKKLIVSCMIISLILIMFSEHIFNAIISFVSMWTGGKYNKYIINESNESFNIINYLLRWFFVLFYFNYYNVINIKNKDTIFYLGLCAALVGSINNGIVIRIVEYYMISIYVIISTSHQAFKGIGKVLYLLLIYLAFIVILIRFLYTFYYGQLLEYSVQLL